MRLMRKGVGVLAAAVLFGATAGACAGDSAKDGEKAKSKPSAVAAKATDQVTVKDFVFGPHTVRVKAGSTVTWTNQDAFDHSVQIDSLMLDGPKFGPVTTPATFSHLFDTPGTYAYICGVHNSMTGTVIVTR